MNTFLDLKTTSDNGFEGYGSVFYAIDRQADIILPGAFKEGLPVFLKHGFMGGVGHNHAQPAGYYTEAYEDERGLMVKGRFSEVQSGIEARRLILDGVVRKLSVGIDRETIVASKVNGNQVLDMWRQAGYQPTEKDMTRLRLYKSFRVIRKAALVEVSPVTIPANDQASILSVKSSSEELPKEFLSFINTGRAAMLKLATVETKAGRVISSKNEQKLRAMLEVLTSVTDELNLLLETVVQNPVVQTDEEGNPVSEGQEIGEGKDSNAKQLEDDEDFAKQRGKDKKSAEIETARDRLRLALELN